MNEGNPSGASAHWTGIREPMRWADAKYAGRGVFQFFAASRRLVAFTLITLGVFVTKRKAASEVIVPSVRRELAGAGIRLLPMLLFMSGALGVAVIGQVVSWSGRVGADAILGKILVVAVIRELGPMVTAMLVLMRAGTRNAIDLATTRALGEVEALEALGIDPIYYLVVPRVVGMALGAFALTIYFILGTLGFGYLFAFLNGIPLRPGEFAAQIADALSSLDFVILTIKSCLFGTVIGVITCYQGLAQPLRLEEVSRASVKAVIQSVVACVLVDVFFILIYLLI
jgi:phospholipid/cholesterol/gamma-HCH transport system permease protein